MVSAVRSFATELLKELVSIPSVNPAFKIPGDDPDIFGEQKIVTRLSEELQNAGCEVWTEAVLPGRHNLMARLPGSHSSGRSILLQSHLDTVQVAGMTVSPWGELRQNRLYGRGSCDTKATAAVFVEAIRHIAAQDGIGCDLYFVGTVDEEHIFSGSRLLGANHRFDACIVGEPTSLRAVTANKGAFRFELVTEGVAAHSSTPELGHNAIQEMVALLSEFTPDFDANTREKHHGLTGNATWSPSLIRGGIGLNTVPEKCTLSVDRRLVPGETPQKVLSFVKGWIAQKQTVKKPWRMGNILIEDPPFEADPQSEVVKILCRTLQDCGCNSRPRGVAYCTDASKITASATPCVVFGPGNIAQAHKKDEWIDLPELDKAVEIVIRTVTNLSRTLNEQR